LQQPSISLLYAGKTEYCKSFTPLQPNKPHPLKSDWYYFIIIAFTSPAMERVFTVDQTLPGSSPGSHFPGYGSLSFLGEYMQ
jgi:hypothetical protein